MKVHLLTDVIDEMVAAQSDRTTLSLLLYRTLNERMSVMHERAQAAEGRALKAEARIARMAERLGMEF